MLEVLLPACCRTFFSFSTISSMLRCPLWHALFSI